MNFSEIFEKYRTNTATEEERQFIDEEIEKNKMISDYLSDQIDEVFGFEVNDSIKQNAEREVKSIRKIIKRKNKKIIITAVLLVFVLSFLYKFAFIPIGSMFFYNPSSSITTYNSSLGTKVITMKTQIATSAFFELHSPTIRTGSLEKSIRTGLGTYEVEFYSTNKFSDEQKIIARHYKYGKIDKPFIEWIDLLNFRVPSDVFSADSHRNEKNDEAWNQMIEKLEAIPTGVSIETSVTFDKALSPSELIHFMNKYNQIQIYWAGVKNGQTNTPLSSGFDPSRLNQEDLSDKKMEQHFLSLLQIEINNESFLKSLDTKFIDKLFYENAKEYVEKNGMKIYGLVLKGNAQSIKRLSEDENIIWMQLENAKFDLY